MSHELSFSINQDGKEILLPSVIDGHENQQEAVSRFQAGTLKPLGVFDTSEEATAFAKKRSAEFAHEVGIQRGAVRVEHKLIPTFITPLQKQEISPPPTVSDTIDAMFRLESDVGNFVDYVTRKEFEPNRDFKWEEWLKENGFWEDHRQNFYGVESAEEAAYLGGRIRKEESDRQIGFDAGWSGMAWAVAAGVLSPTMLIPLTAGGRGLVAVKQGAKFGFFAGAAQEIVLLANQELRTSTEVGVGIGAATILGGILGGAVGHLGKRAEQRMIRRLLGESDEEVAGLAKPPRGSAIPETTPTRIERTPIGEKPKPITPIHKAIAQIGGIRVSAKDVSLSTKDVNSLVITDNGEMFDLTPNQNDVFNGHRELVSAVKDIKEYNKLARVSEAGRGFIKKGDIAVSIQNGPFTKPQFKELQRLFKAFGKNPNEIVALTDEGHPNIVVLSKQAADDANLLGEKFTIAKHGSRNTDTLDESLINPIDESTSTIEGLANLRLAETGGGSVPQPVGAGIPTPKETPEFADAGRAQVVFDALGEFSPVVRSINQKVSPITSWLMSQFSNAGLAVRSGPVGGTIENRLKTYYGPVEQAIRGLDNAYAEYIGTTPGVFVNTRSSVSGFFDKTKLSRPEFNKEVGRSLFSGDASESIPEATKAAQLMRELIYDPLLKAAKDAGLFGEEVDTLGDLSYFNRLYNEIAINANKSVFIDILASNFERQLDAEFIRRLDVFNMQQKRLEENIADMKRSPEDVAEFRNQLKEEIEALDSGRTVELQEIEEQIDELRSQALAAGKDPDAGRPILTETDGVQVITTSPGKKDFLTKARELVAKGGEALKEVHTQRANIRRRLRSLNRSAVTLGDRYVGKLDKIERIEELNIASLNRVGKSARAFLKNMDNLDDTALLDQLAKVQNQFAKAAEGFDRREARIFKEAESEEPVFGKLAALDDLQKSTAERLNGLVRQIEDAEEVFASREVLRDIIQSIRDEALAKVSETISRRALRTQRLSEAADKIAPARVKELIASKENELSKRVGEFSRKIEELGGEGVDPPTGAASFRDMARAAAEESTESILKTGPRLAGMDIIQAERGPMLARVLDIPSEELAQHGFIELNVERAIQIYVRTMAPDIEISLKTGSPNAAKYLGKTGLINTEMNQATKKIAEQAKREGWTEARRQKAETELAKNYKSFYEDLEGVIGRLRHTWGLPDNADAMSYRLGRAAAQLNTLRFMGNVTVASIPDPMRPVMKLGLERTLREGLEPLIFNLKQFNMTRKELKLFGVGNDVTLHTRSAAIFDLFDELTRKNTVERGLSFATGKMGIVAGFDFWNAAWKQFSGVIANARVLDGIQDLVAGKISKKEADYLLANGIDGDLADKIWKELQNVGSAERVNGMWLPNTGQWKDVDTARAFRQAIVGQVDDIIITPGVERPLIVDRNLVGKLAFQFKSFAFASVTKTVMAGLQQRDMAVMNGIWISLALGGLSYYIWAKTVGGRAEQDMLNAGTGKWTDEMITRSGLLAVFGEVHRIAERIPLIEPYVTFSGERTTRRGGVGLEDALLGPSFDLIVRGGRVLGGLDDPTQSTLHNLRLMAPYQNVFWLRQVIDRMEQSVNLPERRNQ